MIRYKSTNDEIKGPGVNLALFSPTKAMEGWMGEKVMGRELFKRGVIVLPADLRKALDSAYQAGIDKKAKHIKALLEDNS